MADVSFEDKFRYDEHGVPRVWKASDDIDGLFKSAREEVLHFKSHKLTMYIRHSISFLLSLRLRCRAANIQLSMFRHLKITPKSRSSPYLHRPNNPI